MKNINISKSKIKIDGIVIVEGKTDTIKLKKLFDVETIETNGLHLSNKTINLIKEISKTRNIILFLDPDGPGEIIRKKILSNIDNCINIFISKKDINFLNNKKIGVAEAYDEAIVKAFKNYVIFDKNNSSISWDEYLDLNLDSREKRRKITDFYHISECNNKQLFKRLNMMNIKKDELKRIINE